MTTKRITLRVTEETYQRWQKTADADGRRLTTWISRRVEGKTAEAPPEEVQLPPKEVVSPNATSQAPRKTTLLETMAKLAEGS